MKLILTGKPATGKTFLLNKLKEEGLNTFNADDFVNDIYQKGSIGYVLISKYFGEEFVNDNMVDKIKLGNHISNNPSELIKLNELIHPIVLDEIYKLDDVVIEIPLIDSLPFKYDAIIELTAPDSVLIERLSNRSSKSDDFATMILQKWDNINRPKDTKSIEISEDNINEVSSQIIREYFNE